MLIKIWEKKNNENALFSGYLVKAAEEITIYTPYKKTQKYLETKM